MTKKVLYLVIVFLIGAITLGGFSFAGDYWEKIEISTRPLNYYINNVERTPPEGQSGFIYKGTTYVPLRFIAESLGEEVYWDGSTYSIYIGDKPEGTRVRMEDMDIHTTEYESFRKSFSKFTSNTGETFTRGYLLGEGTTGWWQGQITRDYILDGKYNSFSTMLVPNKYWTTQGAQDSIGGIAIYGDGEEILRKTIPSDLIEPVLVEVDLSGVLRVRIDMWGKAIGFIDPVFIR